MKKYIFYLLALAGPLQAVFVGNPAAPEIYNNGLFTCDPYWITARSGLVIDYIYKSPCEDLLITEDSTVSTNTIINYFGTFTINLLSRFDVTGFVGTSRMNLNDEIYGANELSYGGSLTLILYKGNCIDLSLGGKYYTTCQKPTYLVVEGMLAPIVMDDELTNLKYYYEEMQGSLCLAYKHSIFIPYIGITYLYSRLWPNANSGLIELPQLDMMVTFLTKSVISRNNWGMVVGTDIISKDTITLRIESRFFDQYAINGSIEFRF